MVGVLPYAIGAAAVAVVGLLVYASGGNITPWLKKIGAGFQTRIDRADMNVKAEDVTLAILAISVVIWLGAVFVAHQPTLVSIMILPLSLAVSTLVGSFYLKFRGDRRINTFVQQLELVLRMVAGSMRVGLGLRQAFILVSEEMPNPARREFMRVIGRTNIGISLVDALDELTKSMPGNEMMMFSRVVRVQQTTGGDLAKVLEKLAATIRDRRRVFRKMSALTAQGRFGGFIVGALPILVGGFVVLTQPAMAQALLHTQPGWITLGIFSGLEGAAIFTLSKILKFDI